MRLAFLTGALLCAATGAHAEPVMQADVLTRAVQRGDIIRRADLEQQDVPASRARFALALGDIVGKEARRALPAGSLVRGSDIAPPTLVGRGEPVTLILHSGALTITAPGKALQNAAAGEAVRVVNLSTSRTLDGRVVRVGEVEIAAP